MIARMMQKATMQHNQPSGPLESSTVNCNAKAINIIPHRTFSDDNSQHVIHNQSYSLNHLKHKSHAGQQTFLSRLWVWDMFINKQTSRPDWRWMRWSWLKKTKSLTLIYSISDWIELWPVPGPWILLAWNKFGRAGWKSMGSSTSCHPYVTHACRPSYSVCKLIKTNWRQSKCSPSKSKKGHSACQRRSWQAKEIFSESYGSTMSNVCTDFVNRLLSGIISTRYCITPRTHR